MPTQLPNQTTILSIGQVGDEWTYNGLGTKVRYGTWDQACDTASGFVYGNFRDAMVWFGWMHGAALRDV